MRVEERRFDHAEDLRKCLAFDAATACRVFDIARAARETPDAPAVDTVPEDAPRILKRVLRINGVRPKAPPDPTIREFTVELGRLAGFQPSKRQPLNPEALVRMDHLRAGDAALPGLQDIRNRRRVKCGKLIGPAQVLSIGDGIWDLKTALHLGYEFLGIGTGPKADQMRDLKAVVYDDFVALAASHDGERLRAPGSAEA